jgi:DNA uptake protein ComE-like DNA-binding protein
MFQKENGAAGNQGLLLLLLCSIVILISDRISFQKLAPAYCYSLETQATSQSALLFRTSNIPKDKGSVVPGNGCNEVISFIKDQKFSGEPRLALFFGQPLAVNRADAETLTLLPGIGPYLAKKITNYRECGKVLNSPELLENIPEIGRMRTARLAPFLRFD